MNANQIMNMVMRIIMRKTISKGIDAGVKQATRSTRGRHIGATRIDMDDGGDMQGGAQNGPTQAQVRQQRQARRAARQARQAAKNTNGPSS